MSDLVLYHNPMSRGRITHWMIEEVGVPYELRILDFEKKEHKAPAYRKINPMGKIPALVHRGMVVTEAAAICAYLADAFPEAKLAPPPTDKMRGPYLRWLFFGAGCVEPALIDHMFKRPQVERPGSLGYGSYKDTMDGLEAAITPGPYILGERFSAADVYIASQIGWGMMTKSIEERDAFKAYVARCSDRPAYKRMAEFTGKK